LDAFWAVFLNLHHQLLKETRENVLDGAATAASEKFTFFNLQYAAKNSQKKLDQK
jgi:hypothetical protein